MAGSTDTPQGQSPVAGAAPAPDCNGPPPAAFARLIADNLPVMIAYYDAAEFRCRFANRLYARSFGHDEQSILGSKFEDVIGAEAALDVRPMLDCMRETLRPVVYERNMGGPGRGVRWIEAQLIPHLDDGAGLGLIGVFVLLTDITRHRLAEKAAQESEDRLGKFMQASAEGIVFQEDGRIVDANGPILELTGYSLAELVGRPTFELIAPDEVARAAAAVASGAATHYESAIVDRHGKRIPVEFIGRTMLRHGERLRMTIVRDIRDRQAVQARIHHLAHHDSLTGLPNRNAMLARLADSIVGSRLTDARLALLFIDLDHFKRVNDSLGHFAGDTLLRTVAARITATLRASDTVARFGGDEFVVLLSERRSLHEHEVDVEQVANKLIAAISEPLDVEGRHISVTPSIGIALFPAHGSTPAELVKNADSAMYLAKSRGRANFQFFDVGLAATALAALVLESQLAGALQHGEFELYFQPQVDARDGRALGAEALIRWNHPERGLLGADAFIPVAEERQLMLPMGQWVLREALACALRWRAMGLGLGPIAVNLSNVQFQSIGFVAAVAKALPPPPVAGGEAAVGEPLIELELTERMLLDDLDEVKSRLADLKAMGLQISIDDFGTGYSSLGHLKDLPIDKLKIDRSFVQDLPDDPDSAAIIRAIVQMGKSLGMTVLAEGIETTAQQEFLAALGCDQLQGLLVGGPMPREAFEAWVWNNRLTRPRTMPKPVPGAPPVRASDPASSPAEPAASSPPATPAAPWRP